MHIVGAPFLMLLALRGVTAQTTPSIIPPERPVDTKLYMAIKAGDAGQVRFFLNKGADPNANFANGWRPLIELEGSDDQRLAIAKILVSKGAKINYRQPGQGLTPLTWSLSGGAYPKVCSFLISKGANVNTPMDDGSTALHEAVRAGSVEAVRLLLAHGADVHARTHDLAHQSVLPADLADLEVKESAQRTHRIAVNLEPGFKFSGCSPIFGLAYRWSDSIANLLLRAGAQIDETDDNGWTLLHYAVKNANVEAIRGLLKRGLNPNVASNEGFRPLHVAMRAGLGAPFEAGIDLLLRAGGDLSLRNKAHQTPIELLRADMTTRFTQLLSDGNYLDQQSKVYIADLNKLIRKLDPSADPVKMPTLPVDALGTHYSNLDWDEGIIMKRAVRVERGLLVLDLVFEDGAESPSFFTIEDVRLGGAAPITTMPIRLKGEDITGRHILIKFPIAKAKDRRVGFKYRSSGPGGRSSSGTIGDFSK